MPRKERIRSIYASEPGTTTPTDLTRSRTVGGVEIPAGAVTSDKLGVIQEVWWPNADWTTTTTGVWETVTTLTTPIPGGNYAFYFWCTGYMKHSAANATVQLRIQISWDDALVDSYVVQRTPPLNLEAANVPRPFFLTVGFNGPSNLPAVLPGKRTIYVVAKNDTAGTLTVIGNTTDTVVMPVLHSLVTGDST